MGCVPSPLFLDSVKAKKSKPREDYHKERRVYGDYTNVCGQLPQCEKIKYDALYLDMGIAHAEMCES